MEANRLFNVAPTTWSPVASLREKLPSGDSAERNDQGNEWIERRRTDLVRRRQKW